MEHKDQWRKKLKNWVIYFSRRFRFPKEVLQLNRQDINFLNTRNITYLGVTFTRRMTWRHYKQRTVAKDLHTYIRTYSLSKNGCLTTNIKLTLYKALIGPVLTCLSHLEACGRRSPTQTVTPAEQNIPRYYKFERRTPVRDLHEVLKTPYMYEYITKLYICAVLCICISQSIRDTIRVHVLRNSRLTYLQLLWHICWKPRLWNQ
jgi:hypothetical protein